MIEITTLERRLIKLVESEKAIYYGADGIAELPTSKKSIKLHKPTVDRLVVAGVLYCTRYTKKGQEVLRVSNDYYTTLEA